MALGRSRTVASATLGFLLAAGGIASPSAHAQDAAELSRWYEALRELAPDPTRGATVEGLTLSRDVGTLHFDRGQMHLLEPLGGRTFGAVFLGEGRFEMTAPERVEQDQLKRRYGSASVAAPFRAAVLLFTDSTLTELGRSLTWGPVEPERDAEREAEEARDYFTDGDGGVDPKVALPLVNSGPGFFYAHVSERRGDPMIFSVDPRSFEEVSLSRRANRDKRREVVAQFHQRSDYETGRSTPQEGLDLIQIVFYDIETTIEDDLDVVGRATATVRRLDAGYDWIPFALYSGLDVDSVRWGDGSAVDFYRPDDATEVWVDVSTAPAPESELTFHYAGEMMERIEQRLWVVLETHTLWYPVYQAGRPIPYRLTFHAPHDHVVTTVGTQVSESTDGDVTTRVWETPLVQLVTFNIGRFDEYDSIEPGAPSLTVLVDEGSHREFRGMVSDRGGFLLEQEDMAEMVAIDVRNSFRFYDQVYGPTTVRDFVATEIPYNHGEAYPGLVMLAWNTFQWTTRLGFDEMFRAHEVAHQWWGISVRPATYRDWWIAEGFSEFSGWWYAARARGSANMYLERLAETREEILDRRDELAPVALGRRAGTSERPQDYQTAVYHKGAWVLHMLRTLLTDHNTGSDEVFTQVMTGFYESHLGGQATTRDFQRAVEQVVGADMTWFFDQWVYGSAIPTYRFSYTVEELPDGTARALVRIRQEDVPEDFRMIVPILLDFGDEGSAIVQVNVVGPVTEAELPLLPREPEDIVFNPLEAVLAETRTERWRD